MLSLIKLKNYIHEYSEFENNDRLNCQLIGYSGEFGLLTRDIIIYHHDNHKTYKYIHEIDKNNNHKLSLRFYTNEFDITFIDNGNTEIHVRNMNIKLGFPKIW